MNPANHSTETLASALVRYFDENGFGKDGGYGDAWVEFKLGRLTFPFPNTASRKKAVRFHDLHHLVTGYPTDPAGEFAISAWEIGSGCRGFVAAWQLNLGGMAGGLLVSPRATFRAFRRGLRSKNFYGSTYESLLDRAVDDAKRDCAVDQILPPPTFEDIALFALAELAGFVVGTVTLVVALPLALIALPFLRLAAKKARSAEAIGHAIEN